MHLTLLRVVCEPHEIQNIEKEHKINLQQFILIFCLKLANISKKK